MGASGRRGDQNDDAPLRRSRRIQAKPTTNLWYKARDGCEHRVVCKKPWAQARACITAFSSRLPCGAEEDQSLGSISPSPLTTFTNISHLSKRRLRSKRTHFVKLSWNKKRKRTFGTRNCSLPRKHYMGSHCQHAQIANVQVENNVIAELSRMMSWNSGAGGTFEGLNREKNADMSSSLCMDMRFRTEEATSYMPESCETVYSAQTECKHINTGSFTEQVAGMATLQHHFVKLTGSPTENNVDMIPAKSLPCQLIQEESSSLSLQERLQPLASNASNEKFSAVFQTNPFPTTASGLLSQVIHAASCNPNFSADKYLNYSIDSGIQNSCRSGNSEQTLPSAEDGRPAKSFHHDFELEQPHHYASLNSSITINTQTLDLMPAERTENLSEVGEGGECIIDTYNGNQRHVGETCEKTRLSKLRNKIRASRQSNLSEEWRRDLDLNKDPPEKNVKRKKHRPKVLQDSKPKRKSRGRKRKGQDMKETTTCNVHEVLLDDEDATEKPQATLDSSSRLSMLKVVAGNSQHYECCGRESQHALICHESLDRDSALQVQISTVDIFRDQSLDNSLDSQNLSLSLSFSNENLLNRYLCARSFPIPGPEKKKSTSTTSRRSSGRRRGGNAIEVFGSTLQLEHWEIRQESAEAGNAIEHFDSTLQLEHWGIQQESAKAFSCLQTGREQDVYALSADEMMKNQRWARGRHAGRKAGICNQSKLIGVEYKGSVASQVRDERMVGEAVYHNFLECNEELQAISWLDSVSQGSHINHGELNDQDESSCKLLLGPPCCVYKPQSDASCVSTITNSPHPVEMETLLWNTECLQIVPYNQKREIVPSMPLRKGKKKPRAKVHLDEETNRVWLLLENGGALPEEADHEKARIWEKERAMMKGRVDTFIKVMHSVQGDRRFSQWKGSIVDSIVGAFLTQNVSDHLSSSAFMSLASRFPARRTQKDLTDLQETRNLDPSLAAYCYDGSLSMLPKGIGLDLIECHTIDSEPTLNGISCRGTTNAIDSFYPIDTPADNGPMQCNIFTGSRTEASHRVRRRLQFEQGDVSNERHHTFNSMSFSGVEIQPSICDHNYVDKVWPLGYVENEKRSGNGEMSLAILESAQEKDSRLQTVEESKPENLSLEKGKKRLYQVSRITGIERAQLEVSQGGYKKNRRDWDSLRRQVIGKFCDEASNEASTDATQQNAIDWEAIRLARIEAVADAIKERGMHNILSGRIKAFLTRLHEDHGSLDLEWIRKLSIEDARDYLLDIRGLGIKSVECIRLLTLHHLAFPVDTNVGRICVRLGWVPIQPLPEELQLHLLELYPVQETIQKYLWPRLCTLDQRTLYELHYQMITFGKVFCTKSKPNCNSCPLRTDCKHFASAFASSKLLLKSSSTESNMTGPLALPLLPAAKLDLNEPETSMICLGQSWVSPSQQNQICEPIIEEPTTPEYDHEQAIHDIEDMPYIYNEPSDYADYLQSDDIETICLNGTSSHLISFEEANEQERFVFESPCPDSSITSDMPFSQFQDIFSDITLEGLASQSQSTGSDVTSEKDLIQFEGSLTDLALERDVNDSQCIIPHNASNAIVAVSLESAYIPVPKLKNVGRLRTVHYVYEIPDDHPLIREMDAREKDDPSFYLLAIWSPDEVPQSQEEIDQRCKEIFCGSGTSGHDETVKGTLLIPCRTAMRGSFPLNGTYFQVNEVFADHESSVHPLEVPRSWIWNLRRRFVYFGTSVPNIFRGLSREEIRSCFWLGHVCVRGFDRNSRAPKPLVARLHFPASKQIKAQRRSSSKVTT